MTTVTASPQSVAARSWLARGLVGIAAGLVVLAVLGPLVTGAVDYRVSETLRHQTIGLDAVSLCLVAPLALAGAALARRGRGWAPEASLGVAGWFGLVGPAVAAMAIAMRLGHDPGATTGATLFMTALGLAFAALAVWAFRPLARA